MPRVRLPIYEGMTKSVDELGPTIYGADLVNAYINEQGEANRFPGLEEFAATGEPAGIDGLKWWGNEGIVIANCNGKTFKITNSAGTMTEIAGDTLQIARRVKYAEHYSAIYAANGAKIHQITTSAVSALTDADAPTEVTHVAILDRYLIGNESDTGNFHWSDLNAPTVWSGNYSEAEADPDKLVALDVQRLTIHALGKRVLEKWYNNAGTFERLYQGVVQSGSVAPYSFTWCPAINSFMWIDQNRGLVKLDASAAIPVSLTLDKYIKGLSGLSDALGDYVEIAGRPYFILTFLSDEKNLAYDFITKQWFRLGSWDSTHAEYKRYRGNCYCHCPDWNITLVGDRANGKIYKFSPTTYTEGSEPQRVLIQTPRLDHGAPSVQKHSERLLIKVKKTKPFDGAAKLLIGYRDNGNTSWTPPRVLDLPASGENEFLLRTERLGAYYSRQWRFYMSDDYPLCIASVEEDVDI